MSPMFFSAYLIQCCRKNRVAEPHHVDAAPNPATAKERQNAEVSNHFAWRYSAFNIFYILMRLRSKKEKLHNFLRLRLSNSVRKIFPVTENLKIENRLFFNWILKHRTLPVFICGSHKIPASKSISGVSWSSHWRIDPDPGHSNFLNCCTIEPFKRENLKKLIKTEKMSNRIYSHCQVSHPVWQIWKRSDIQCRDTLYHPR
jgi:hypothetical protein